MAVCAHHPDFRAVAICEGSGDFVCALCAAEVGGHPYSVQFLEKAGPDFFDKKFRRALPRPDRKARQWVFIMFLVFPPLLPVAVIMAIFHLANALRLRRTDALFRMACPAWRPWLGLCSLAAIAAGAVVAIGWLIAA